IWHVIPADGKLFEVRSRSEGFTVDKGYLRVMSQLGLKDIMYSTVLPPKPRKMPGRPKKKRIRATDECCSSTRVSKVGSQGSCSNCKQHGHNKSSCKEPVVEQTPKPKGVVGRPRKKQPVDNFKDVDVVQRGPMRDEGTAGSRGGASGPEVEVMVGQKGNMCQLLEHKKDKVRRRLGLLAWLYCLDCKMNQSRVKMNQKRLKLNHNRLNMNMSKHKLKTQAEIDLTQVEQTQEQTQEQVQPQEQPQQAALRMPSARILQRKLGKQGSSQNTALNLD
ncbi:hypothetical protein Tco_0808107, partial [Tanacetum coccineum]